MSVTESANQYFTYESRLTSFKKPLPVSKRRASNTNIKGPKSLKWPHKFLSAQDLARAGFFYFPIHDSPDNVACFICHSSLDGWEENDDPLIEHLRHSPDCGWAINAMIERLEGDWSKENPYSIKILEARRATFANKWPHEDKKGWKCHVKQMTEAGWKYTPTPESDDMVQCNYCALTIDKWGKNDIPSHKHYELSPDCPFFTFEDDYKRSPGINKIIPIQTRLSRSSRLSTQSNLTIDSFASCQEDLPAEDDDNSLLLAFNSKRKMDKGKKTTIEKTWNTRFKKEPIHGREYERRKETRENSQERKRSNKRSSENSLHKEEAEIIFPLPKRRTTRNRGSIALNKVINTRSNISSQSTAKSRPKKRSSHHKNPSSSSIPPEASIPNDADIDRELGADLDRLYSEDEALGIPRIKKNIKFNPAMLSTSLPDIDDRVIEAELKVIEMEEKRPTNNRSTKTSVASKKKTIPKKLSTVESQQQNVENSTLGGVTDLRSSTNQTSPQATQKKKLRGPARQATRQLPPRRTRGSALSSRNHDNSNVENKTTEENLAGIHNDIDISRPINPKISTENSYDANSPSQNIHDTLRDSVEPYPNNTSHSSIGSARKDEYLSETSDSENKKSRTSTTVISEEVIQQDAINQSMEARSKRSSQSKIVQKDSLLQQISQTKSTIINPETLESNQLEHLDLQDKTVSTQNTPSPKSSVISILAQTPPKGVISSRSSPFSDVENQPPSPNVLNSTQKIKTTPIMQRSTHKGDENLSCKQNVIAGLKSNSPWTAVDLEAVCWKCPSNQTDTSNSHSPRSLEQLLDGIYKEDLTNLEKKMTVEEWIHYNAQLAEGKLTIECEWMVGNFEREGTRAIRALEGVECVE